MKTVAATNKFNFNLLPERLARRQRIIGDLSPLQRRRYRSMISFAVQHRMEPINEKDLPEDKFDREIGRLFCLQIGKGLLSFSNLDKRVEKMKETVIQLVAQNALLRDFSKLSCSLDEFQKAQLYTLVIILTMCSKVDLRDKLLFLIVKEFSSMEPQKTVMILSKIVSLIPRPASGRIYENHLFVQSILKLLDVSLSDVKKPVVIKKYKKPAIVQFQIKSLQPAKKEPLKIHAASEALLRSEMGPVENIGYLHFAAIIYSNCEKALRKARSKKNVQDVSVLSAFLEQIEDFYQKTADRASGEICYPVTLLDTQLQRLIKRAEELFLIEISLDKRR